MIVNHQNKAYIRKRNQLGAGQWNGAYYYSKEITDNIIPNVETDRNWVLVNIPGQAFDHSIVFIHNNLHPENYEWLKAYKDLVLVCGIPETVEKVKHLGEAIYIPLSIDVEYVKRFKKDVKKKGAAYVGRKSKAKDYILPEGIKMIGGIPREELLKIMNGFETVYGIGRIAIEARALNCNVAPCDPRFPDPSFWKVVDNKEAATMLQKELNRIDGKEEEEEIVVSRKSTKAELLAYAEAEGIEVDKNLTKKEILELIGL